MSFKLELKESLDPALKLTLKEDAFDYDENSDKDQLIWDHLSMKIADNCKELLGIDSEQVPEQEWIKLIDTLVRICKMTKGFEYKEESVKLDLKESVNSSESISLEDASNQLKDLLKLNNFDTVEEKIVELDNEERRYVLVKEVPNNMYKELDKYFTKVLKPYNPKVSYGAISDKYRCFNITNNLFVELTVDTSARTCDLPHITTWKLWLIIVETTPVEESIKSDICPSCGKPYDKDGRCYNQDCEQYDPLSQYFDEPEEGFKLDLKEAFNSNFPEWIMKGLKSNFKGRDTDLKRSLVQKHIDLANATFIETLPPQSNRDPVLKDTTRLAVFHIRDDRGDTYIYTPDGACNPYVRVGTDGAIEYKYIDQLSWKWILDHTMDYGYFDMSNSDTTASALRTKRMGAKRGSVDRGLGQYKRTGYDGETYWVTAKGEDKSGYKLDPQKYTRMLDNVNLNNYSARLESHYAKIEEVRAGIIEALQSADLLNKDYLAKGSFSSGVTGDISDAISRLDRAIYYYKELCSQVERIIKQNNAGKFLNAPDTVDDAIKDVFRFNSNNVREHLKDASAIVAHIKSNPVRPVVED